jgi:hypothetical protein
MLLVAGVLPGGDLTAECVKIGDTPVEALLTQDREFD